jgi:hypothetical protein
MPLEEAFLAAERSPPRNLAKWIGEMRRAWEKFGPDREPALTT